MNFPGRSHWRPAVLTLGVLVTAALLQFADANPAVSQTLFVTAYGAPADPGLDPTNAAWDGARVVQVPLSGQLGSYAAGGGSIATVNLQAVHFKEHLYVRVSWADVTVDESTTKVEDFSDAVALEFPALSASTVPSICM
ncbi:MAG: ethylbenzene dehydrogenase-related protein, partial [Anaerolineaceae bacterium]